MTLPVTLAAAAEADLIQTADWYDRRSPGLGDAFLGEVDQCIDYLESHPRLYQSVLGEVRRALIDRFPYQLLDRILSHEVQIVAVLHCRVDAATIAERANRPTGARS